jgi:hypothetical protein
MSVALRPGVDFSLELHPPAGIAASFVYQWGLDYAWGFAPGLVQALRSNGTQFACRYVNDAGPGGKGISAGEALALQETGITICPVWETTGTDFTGGYASGVADGQGAAAALRRLGAPAGTYCWFAIDTGTSDFASTNAYLRGCKAGSGSYIAQLYGSYDVVEAAHAAGLGDRHWQTYAWSRGLLSGHAALYQYQNGVMIGGVSCDRDKALQDLGGPWAHFGPSPVVPLPVVQPVTYLTATETEAIVAALPVLTPGITDAQLPAWYVRRVQSVLNDVYGASPQLTVDGNYGPASQAAVRTLIQARYGLTQDAIVGRDTWTALVTGAA